MLALIIEYSKVIKYMKYAFTTLGLGLLSSFTAWAAPNDLYLQANSFTQTDTALSIGIDAVNDTIDVFNIRESEGVSEGAGDYIGAHVHLMHEFSPTWGLEASYQYREIDYAQDTNTISSPLLAVRYTPDFNLNKNDTVTFRLSTWGNFSDEIKKSTPTQIQNRTLEQITVQDAQDWQLQLDSIFSRKIDHMNMVNLFTTLGYSKVKVDQLNIQGQKDGCLMDLQIQSNNQYTGQLSQPCTIDDLIVKELNAAGDANEFGIDIQKDLNYDAFYAGFGGSWNWRYRNFESQLAYQYQRLWRKDIDDRISNFGAAPIKDNHSIGLKLNYDFSPQVRGFIKGEMYQHNLIGYIPFLYNGVTASRLDKKYGLASVGITLHNF